MRLEEVLKDLTAEGDEVDRLVADLSPEQWALPTPAPGWTVANQIAHLDFIFRLAGTAASDAAAFREMTAKAKAGFDAAVNAALAAYADDTPEDLLTRWRAQRVSAVEALAAVPAGETVPWLVNPLPPAVLACAGIMELFAHGQDIADALGVRPERTDRLRHLVGFAVLTRDFGYQARGLTAPDAQFRFEITAPSGELWEFGPADAEQRVSGPAVDFCLLVTRRRHRDDLAVTAVGAEADQWLDIAQAYRGPAGPGRAPGQFAALAA
ncbi:TIGR03084 family metal-binding protein [Sphaerimonospora thailandensis]|uniref:Wyosine base formation n=1 Tax=Sphaerimonospora thailandensis TaxID=795644 RepID=A0A8J3R5P8_9ACTN|nr:TIGR03084 family metal-binding protein [Sphaerimonospora thailandensis]GIH67812.1 wyosine base formation [Sphaerimonospora thailandensis]